MTANENKVRQKLAIIEDNLKKLNVLKQQTSAEFLGDFRNVESAKHLLQVSIETMVDIADHLIAKNRLGTPENLADSFKIMAQNGWLKNDNLDRYIVMTKFRNKVVHLYYEIKDEEIFKILQNDLGDFEAFIGEITKLM